MSIATAGTYDLDVTHTEVGFTVRHLMSKVRGAFEKFEGTFVIAESLEDSTVSVTVQMDSINTGTPDRDGHLRSADLFEIDKFPTMTFVSTGIKQDGDTYVIAGDLTIKGVSKPVELTAEFLGEDADAYGNRRVGIEATTTINRKDFGVDYNIPLEGGKLLIGEKVSIEIFAQGILRVAANAEA